MNKKIKAFLKQNWDLVSAYAVLIIGSLLVKQMFSTCEHFECLGGIGYALIVALISAILGAVALYRNLKVKKFKKDKIRWILTILLLGYLGLKYFGVI